VTSELWAKKNDFWVFPGFIATIVEFEVYIRILLVESLNGDGYEVKYSADTQRSEFG